MHTYFLKPTLIISIFFVFLTSCATQQETPGVEDMHRILAPSGKLRMGLNEANVIHYILNEKTGEVRGLGHALGSELAKRLGVEFEVVPFKKNSDVTSAAASGVVDLIFTNASPARKLQMDFTDTVIEFEQGYLVPAGSKIKSLADVDQAGVKIGVVKGSTTEGKLSKELKQATLVSVADMKAAAEDLSTGKINTFTTNKAHLYELSDGISGSSVLGERTGLENLALAIPKYRKIALPYLNEFVKKIKEDGTLKGAAEKAKLRGFVKEEAKP